MGATGWLHFFNGAFNKAIESLHEWYLVLEGAKSPFLFLFAWLQAATRNFDEAFRIMDQIVHNNPEHIIASLMFFLKHALLGEKQKALDAVTDQLEKAAKWDDLYAHIMAEGYALIGEYDCAFTWLNHSIKYGIANEGFLSEYDPFLANIRGEQRFKKLMERVKHEWENLEV